MAWSSEAGQGSTGMLEPLGGTFGTLGAIGLYLFAKKRQRSLELIDVCLRNGIEDVFERRKMWMISHHQETIIGLNHLSIKYKTTSITRLISVVVYSRIGK